MRRPRIFEIFTVLILFAILVYFAGNEGRERFERRKFGEFLSGEFYSESEEGDDRFSVDLGERRNVLKAKFDESLKEELTEAAYQRELLKFLKNEEAKESIAEFELALHSDPLAYQLPNIVITGAKKCGTKALQRFFGHHPQVIRGYAESPFQTLEDSELSFKNYLKNLYRIWSLEDLRKKIEENEESDRENFFMAKTGMAGIKWLLDYLEENPALLEKHENLKIWKKNVQCITILCDPVHRLLSDFKHMKDDKAGHMGHLNKKTLGSDSALMPLADLSFDKYVETYLPLLTENANSDGVPREMTTVMANGAYGYLYKYYRSNTGDPKIFANTGLILDGNSLKSRPWEVMMELERFLKLEKFFDEEKFVKREDGYYCVRDETAESGMDCMPSSKGRTSINPSDLGISAKTEKMLREYYKPRHVKLARDFNLTLSWLSEWNET